LSKINVFFFEGRFIRIHFRFSTEKIRRKEEIRLQKKANPPMIGKAHPLNFPWELAINFYNFICRQLRFPDEN
jgi:hypothetical protein